VNDFHPVTFVQRVPGMFRTRHDGAIDFHRHAALGQAFGREQGCEGAVGSCLSGLAIQLDVHGEIFACFVRQARGGATCDR
jgi:hypothetical protein